MKFTKMIVMLVLVGMFLFGSVQVASAATAAEIAAALREDIAKLQEQFLALVAGQGNVVEIDNSTIIPAPLLPAPDFLIPVGTINGIWTSGKMLEGVYTIPELCRVANPSRALLFFWYEWSKSYQIEMACHIKAKHTRSLRIQSDTANLTGLTKLGRAHARAVELHKSEAQVVAALGVYAAKQGATVMVITSFSNAVTKGDSAVIGGGGGASTDPRYIINGAGGFGWTTSERVHRAFVTATLYK